RNYLVPIDAQVDSEPDVDRRAIDLELVLRSLPHEVRTKVIFLDACRDNPFAAKLARRAGTRPGANLGLAQVVTGVGTLIAFATEPGNVALDGDGRNSPFTAALLDAIERPGLHIGDLMIDVRNEVLRKTAGKQVPWEHSSLTGRFYFASHAAAS